MTLFNIAIKNIKRNFYNYFLYFFSMVFSIMIYFVFTSIQYNKQVLEIPKYQAQITNIFKTSSIVVAVFAIIFIWYSNSFFTKRRKKEVGLYSLMGVKKKQIGRMLFYENILMGTIALITGIFAGSLLSKLFTMLLFKLMGFSVYIEFAIIPKAIINTIITFAILFFITSIHGYTIVYRFKLIDLFRAEKKSEKEPKGSIIFAILSILLIGGGYLLHFNADKYVSFEALLITLVTVVVGTYFLFSSLVIFIIKLAKRNKIRYYKGINMIGTSQLLYRIKSSSRTLATIAVLSATTLTAMGVTSSFYYDFQTKIDIRNPFSYVYLSEDINLDDEIEDIISKYPENKMLNSVELQFLKMQGKLPNVQKSKIDSEFLVNINVISQSMFNDIAKVRGLDERIEIKNIDESVFIDERYNSTVMESYTGKVIELNLNNEKMQFNIVDFKTYPLINEYITRYILVVKDEVYDEYNIDADKIRGKAYIIDNKKDSAELDEELTQLITKSRPKENYWEALRFTSYYTDYSDNLANTGLIVFVGAFLGLVFLLSTGSIIFFKQLSEAYDDKIRYNILRKIGVNKKEIKASISKQMLFVFLLPLLVGINHSLVALSILDKFLDMSLFIPISITMGAYTLIYMIYYFLTVNSYSKIVNSRV